MLDRPGEDFVFVNVGDSAQGPGDIAFQGLTSRDETEAFTVAITGGTGDFRNVRCEATVEVVSADPFTQRFTHGPRASRAIGGRNARRPLKKSLCGAALVPASGFAAGSPPQLAQVA